MGLKKHIIEILFVSLFMFLGGYFGLLGGAYVPFPESSWKITSQSTHDGLCITVCSDWYAGFPINYMHFGGCDCNSEVKVSWVAVVVNIIAIITIAVLLSLIPLLKGRIVLRIIIFCILLFIVSGFFRLYLSYEPELIVMPPPPVPTFEPLTL